jgi:hypothetical protein
MGRVLCFASEAEVTLASHDFPPRVDVCRAHIRRCRPRRDELLEVPICWMADLVMQPLGHCGAGSPLFGDEFVTGRSEAEGG